MAVKVTKRTTNDGVRYSISGLTFSQLFRIKNGMFEEERRMKETATHFEGAPWFKKEFEGYAKDAHEVAIAANEGCV